MLTAKTIITTLFFIIFCNCLVSAQELVQVIDETITVNSTTAITGYTRNITEINLPQKTKAYIYRLSIFPKGKSLGDNTLFDLLKKMGGINVSIATSFAQFAIKNNDNYAVDAFIFNNTYDSDNFYAKKDGNWGSCKEMPNRVNCCFSSKDCLGQKVYFGFRNNNIRQGLDVKLEIVAVVDTSLESDYNYSYTIFNSTNRELKFMLSLDNLNWQESSLRNDYQQIYTIPQKEMYFKIKTDNFRSSSYKLTPNDRYKIIWNEKLFKWDLVHY